MHLLLFLVHHISDVAQGSILRMLISFRSSATSWKILLKQTQLNRFDNLSRGVRLVFITIISLKEVTRRC